MKRSKFSLSHYKLASFDQGQLIPVGCYEVLPGDTVQQATTALLRVTPLNAPVMHPTHMQIHHWYVPNRLIWEDWEDFITGGEDGLQEPVHPTIGSGAGFAVKSLADYFGCPISIAGMPVSALPFRAYSLIWNKWYRDQQLQTERVIDLTSGTDTTTDVTLARQCWEKDYFTSCRPEPQLGPEVSIPVSGASITRTDSAAGWVPYASNGNTPASAGAVSTVAGPFLRTAGGGGQDLSFDPVGGLTLSNAEILLNTLRGALAVQTFQEARNNYGGRYTEYLRYLGIRSSDARLQLPEYLGGGKQTVQFSEVLQTAPTTDGDDSEGIGNMKGHGIGSVRSNRFRRFFEEHGFVISLMVVKPRTMYVQGLPRMWSRIDKTDYWQKEFQHIGQQEVLNKELYAAHSSANGTFGYQDRYDEYRRIESSVSGEFRTTLNYWHMAREFSSDPTLNSSFVTATPTDRIYQETTASELLGYIHHSIQARRMLSKTGWTNGLLL